MPMRGYARWHLITVWRLQAASSIVSWNTRGSRKGR